MSNRRILSLWFPRLSAERVLRLQRGLPPGPFAVVADVGNAQVLSSLSAQAQAQGLTRDQPLRDARAMCPELVTQRANPQLDAEFLTVLRRWAGKYSPWVSAEPPAALIVDLTGCAHLFGGESGVIAQVEADCFDLGLTVTAGIADTVGAAWALARYAGIGVGSALSSDAIDQEAPSTRARAAKRRHWERGGAAPGQGASQTRTARIAVTGQTRQVLAPLPIAALRLPEDTVLQLNRLGLRRIDDIAGQPRASLARRFGRELVRRLDQAMGVEPEPVNPSRPPAHFATRLSLPEPIGRTDDVLAALDRLLPPLCARLKSKGRGARRVRLSCYRTDHGMQWIDVGLARPSHDPDRIRPLLAMKVDDIDAGFGIEKLRIEALVTEPVHDRQHRGHVDAASDGATRMSGDIALDDLIGRIGARIGLESITRLHTADSHIPEKTQKILAAAWSDPATDWTAPVAPRPVLLWRPEMVTAQESPNLPMIFRWRRRDFETRAGMGPERIAPEWWLDEPAWRTGVRDYWRVTTRSGDRLWLYFAHGGAMTGGWFCHGSFA